MIKRRYFVLGTIAAVAGVAALRFAFSSEQESIIAILHKRLNYLKLDADGVRNFARDMAALHSMSSTRLRMISAMGPVYALMDPNSHNSFVDGIRHGEERVVTKFLLSSDFFANNQDESRTVHYVGFYDPLRACGNPFAHPV